jgi:hypothetical protein
MPRFRTFAVGVLRIVLGLCLLIAIAVALRLFGHWMAGRLHDLAPRQSGPALLVLLVLSLIVYAVLIAVPFVPGVEIGLTLMMLRGPSVVIWVYLATICGLALAYSAGRFLPYAWLRKLFDNLHLTRAARLLARVEPLAPEERLALLRNALPQRAQGLAGRGRYVLLALLVNMPGSSLLGGGGGILMMAGLSRVFTPLATLMTVLIAVAPIPVVVWVFGIDPLAHLMGN